MDTALSRTLGTLLLLSAAACSSSTSGPDGTNGADTPSFTGAGAQATPGQTTTNPNPGTPGTPADPPEDPDPPGPPLDPNVDPATHTNPEVVQVLMEDWNGGQWFCTGTLIAADVAITAGHCLDTSQFKSVHVRAQTLASHDESWASFFEPYDWNWEDVGHPDLGVIKLFKPITLGRYATLTDVTATIDGGQSIDVGAVVRTDEKPTASMKRVGPLKVSSSTADGYPSSYAVPMFSEGGDSGAGMFQFANGKTTHKLVAVEHTPDPGRGQDHISRIDAKFIQWVAQKTQ